MIIHFDLWNVDFLIKCGCVNELILFGCFASVGDQRGLASAVERRSSKTSFPWSWSQLRSSTKSGNGPSCDMNEFPDKSSGFVSNRLRWTFNCIRNGNILNKFERIYMIHVRVPYLNICFDLSLLNMTNTWMKQDYTWIKTGGHKQLTNCLREQDTGNFVSNFGKLVDNIWITHE